MLNASPDKHELRRIMKGRRAAAFAKNPKAAIALRDHFLSEINLPQGTIVAGYAAQNSEIDPLPLLTALQDNGHPLALPAGEKDEAICFRAFKPGDALFAGRNGIPEPAPGAAILEPDIVLVPLLAFDASGHRLGRGGGHYDRTLAALRKRRQILAIGLAFADQQLSAIPCDSHDARLDKIATEIEVMAILNAC